MVWALDGRKPSTRGRSAPEAVLQQTFESGSAHVLAVDKENPLQGRDTLGIVAEDIAAERSAVGMTGIKLEMATNGSATFTGT